MRVCFLSTTSFDAGFSGLSQKCRKSLIGLAIFHNHLIIKIFYQFNRTMWKTINAAIVALLHCARCALVIKKVPLRHLLKFALSQF